MFSLVFRHGVVLLPLLLAPACAHAADDSDIWASGPTQAWLDDHLAAAQRPSFARPIYRLARTEIWASGIARSGMHAFSPDDSGRTVGAKLQPFRDLDLRIGTELIRGGGEDRPLASRASWEAFWARDWESFGGLNLGLSTTGALDSQGADYFQSVTGTLGIPVGPAADMWRTELRLSPSMGLDTSSGEVGTSLMSEVIGQRVLSSHADAFRSILMVRVGYGVAPGARPTASAKLEIRISPNL